MKTGKLIIFSAPSGSGKTTLVKHVLSIKELNLSFSISATSRSPRKGDINGKDYFFLTPQEFQSKIDHEDFIEYEEVYKGSFYGTLKEEVQRIWNLNKHVVFDIDVIGGLNIKKKYPDQTLAIFINTPDINILEKRLRDRGLDSKEMLNERIKKALEEIKFGDQFDIQLVNGNLSDAKLKAEDLIKKFIES